MRRALGDHRPATLAKSSFFGVISSSCSYASSALGEEPVRPGADFTASMVFMVASTNLVVELGIVLWLLIGWQFALAEFVGGAIMIVLLGLVLPRVIPERWIARGPRPARTHDGDEPPTVMPPRAQADGQRRPWRLRLRSRAGWARCLRLHDQRPRRCCARNSSIGFVIAGFCRRWCRSLLAVAVPHRPRLLVEPAERRPRAVPGHHQLRLLASATSRSPRRSGTAESASAASSRFVFADLITLPLLLIYRKYYGSAITLRLLGDLLGDR